MADAAGGRPGSTLASGPGPAEARAAAVIVHGRGGSPEGILELAAEIERRLARPGEIAWLAPRAEGGTWYPYGFMEPLERNRPALDRALETIGDAIAELEAAGVPAERIVLLGFSQGACLSLEFAARNARRYGGVAGLSGGLIGPPGTPRDYPGSLDGTPIFLGCSDEDPHIPESRVHESAQTLASLEGHVAARIYPGLGHTVNDDEMGRVAAIFEEVG